MIDISYNKEENVVYWTLTDEIRKDDIIESMNHTNELVINRDSINIIQIDKDSKSLVTIKEQSIIGKHVKETLSPKGTVNIAFVGNKPINVAFSVIALNIISGNRMNAKLFSTLLAAKEWLKTK